jgi:hypothetical protein
LTQLRRIDPVVHALVVVKIVERVVVHAKIAKDAFFDVEHRVVVGVDRLQFGIGDWSRVRDTISVNVKEGHENADDQNFGFVGGVTHGVAQRIRPALDLHQVLIGMKRALIEDDSVCG